MNAQRKRAIRSAVRQAYKTTGLEVPGFETWRMVMTFNEADCAAMLRMARRQVARLTNDIKYTELAIIHERRMCIQGHMSREHYERSRFERIAQLHTMRDQLRSECAIAALYSRDLTSFEPSF